MNINSDRLLSIQSLMANKQNFPEGNNNFSDSERIKVLGIIDFDNGAEAIGTLVRNLNSDSDANPLSSAKLILESQVANKSQDYVIVSQLKILETISSKSPGTIIEIAPDKIQIATSSRDIVLKQIKTKQGKSLSIEELVRCYQLEVEKQLPQIDKNLIAQIAKVGCVIAQTESFWVEQLSDRQPLVIPYLQRKLSDSSQEKYAQIEIPISQKVIDFLDQNHAKWQLGDFVLAAFSIYLARLTSSETIILGLNQLSGKLDRQNLDTWFTSDVPLTLTIKDQANFTTVEGLIQKQLEITKQNLTYSTDLFARYPQLIASETGEPLFSVKIAWQDNLAPHQYQFLAKNSFLTLVISHQQEKCFWLYDTEAFNSETITRMLGELTTLIAGIISDIYCPIARLPLLSPQQKHQLLVDWNNTQTDYPQEKGFHQLFEEQVAKNPEAIAVVYENQQLTYRQLNEKANQLAHYLQKVEGVKPEVLVGICIEPSLEMAIALLGILKAGGAYVPLDPNYPQERLTYMLDDSKLSILLTQEKLLDQLPENSAAITCLDRDWDIIDRQETENPVSNVTTSNLAYIIYTSGSTGKPKGVLATHQGLPNLALAQARVFGVKADSCVLQFASFSFDASISEIAMALCCGARLCLAKKESLVPGSPLIRLCREQAVTHITIAPSALAILPEDSIPSIEAIIVAGEACSAELVTKWAKGRRFFNAYGPTETTVCATIAECKDGTKKPSIGRPIANTQIYILDRNLQPVPVGVPGEIYIASVGLARGYLDRPELTKARFIANPIPPLSKSGRGDRLYKTGDLGRWLPNGEIDYLGRSDCQVKIRGFRIELEEIEATVTKHPDVLQTVAMAREERIGDKRIVVYVVTQTDSNVSSKILRQFIQTKLPEYMLPSAIVMLESVPLTPNGKVDKKALPAPDCSNLSQDYVAPRTATEKTLADIWSEVLGIERVGIYDNFFELGGHSLLATQIVSRIREVLGVELSLRYLLEASTIDQLTKVIDPNSDRHSSLPSSIVPMERGINLPLSFTQSRMWFLYQFEGGGSTYNISLGLNLSGNLDIDCLEKALVRVIERHEILRTYFMSTEGATYQVVLPQLNITIPVIDLRELAEKEQLTAVKTLAQQEVGKPFNLEEVPLLRVSLIQLSETSQVLMLTMHHIISDGWSTSILLQELSAYYQELTTGKRAKLAPLPIQYADFALWQRQYFTDKMLAPQLAYWRKQLAGIPPTIELPIDRPRPTVQTFSGSSQSCQLSLELSEKLNILSRKSGATLFMTLLAAFAVLMHRYSQQEDIVIGSPIANRNHSEIESLIGFFVNTLALRIDLKDNPSFTQLVDRVKQVALDAYAHQDVPFEKLVEELQPKRHSSYHPLFQVMFVLQNTPDRDLEMPGLTIEQMEIENVTSKFDLTLSVTETKAGLRGTLEYKTDLFDATTIKRMLGHWQTLLEAIVSEPEVSIAKLPLLTATEKRQLLTEWNPTETNYPETKCLHQLFEAQAEKNPQGVAIVFEEEEITYQELNKKANQLAHYLQKLGVQPETKVGICLERSLETMVGLLGILKAGGAYVPLDPNSPPERLEFILEDANIDILLTQRSLLERLPAEISHLLCLDSEDLFSQEPTTNIVSNIQPSNLVYIIYTSGSTGKPKGVEITHHNVASLFATSESYYQFSATDKWTLFHSFAFDFAVWEIWGALIYGGTLVIVPYLISRSPEQFYRLLSEQKITVLNQTPSAFTQLLGCLEQQKEQYPLDNLRFIIFGGEKLNFSTLKPWYAHQPNSNCQLVNMYGITEITVHATYQPITEQLTDSKQSLIGSPLPDLNIYILDRYLNPVPVGVSGELHIAGEGVARGYLNRPQLTATRFIDNPFISSPASSASSSRLYKTGDLARYLPDGNIEFLGRIDHQVKIRGFRIELGEIEAVLKQHPSVRDNVVIVRKDTPDDQRLVAYIIPSSRHSVNQKELRSFLQQKLPEYMIPAAFVSLEAFPLTSNGKVDSNSLPVPDLVRDTQEAHFIAPRDELEHQLVEIWETVLGIQPISVDDNFFEIGGHSLLTVRLVSEMEKTFKQKLPIAVLFELTTVAQIANILRQNQVNTATVSVEPSSKPKSLADNGSSLPQLPLEDYRALLTTHAHWKSPRLGTKSLVLETQAGNPDRKTPILAIGGMGDMHHHLPSDRPVYSLPVHTNIKSHQIYVKAVAALYVEEILTIQPEGPYILFGYCFGGTVALEIARQLKAQGREIALLFLLERSGFNARYDFYLMRIRPFIAYWREFSKLTFSEQKTYVRHKALHLVNKALSKFTPQVKQVVSSSGNSAVDVAQNPQVNQSDRPTYTNSILRAQKCYKPESYQGRVALYFSYEGARTCWLCPKGGWGNLIQGEVEIDIIPGNSNDLLVEPNVKILADKLNSMLNFDE